MTKQCLSIILIFLFTSLVLAEEKELILGGDAGWKAFSVANNITISDSGRFGKEAVQIATDSAKVSPSTDLLLNFEQNGNANDISGKYITLESNATATTMSIMGNYAALGSGNTGGIRLQGSDVSMFGKEGLTGSFTISFWLNPSIVENGETIFLWDSSRNVNNTPVYQAISAMFYQNRLEWDFTNIFSNFAKFKDINLKSTNLIIPDEWAHHTLSFDDISGIIEYRINGKIEALTYATESGWAQRDIYNAILGVPTEFSIIPHYTGRIDDFSIQKTFQSTFTNNQYNPEGGYFESQPLGPFPYGSTITGIQSISNIPAQTDIQYFVRAGDNFYEWTDSYPEWIPANESQIIDNVQGRFFQVATHLYTDGKAEKTPSVTEIRLTYNETEPPLPPFKVFSDAGNGFVDISWTQAAGTNPDGYIVYYGESPGEYLGEDSSQGDSPIDVGLTTSFRIEGLKNGKAYYFAVAAYSYTPSKVEGSLSKEVYARPLQGERR